MAKVLIRICSSISFRVPRWLHSSADPANDSTVIFSTSKESSLDRQREPWPLLEDRALCMRLSKTPEQEILPARFEVIASLSGCLSDPYDTQSTCDIGCNSLLFPFHENAFASTVLARLSTGAKYCSVGYL